MQNLSLYILSILLIISVLYVIFRYAIQRFEKHRLEARLELEQTRREQATAQTQYLASLQQNITGIIDQLTAQQRETRQMLDQRVLGMQQSVFQQLQGNNQLIGEVKTQLGGLAQTAVQMETLGKDMASLQDLLRAPKLRGNLGEFLLEELLKQVLPSSAFAMQFRLPGVHNQEHVIVDAIVKLGERMVPIDSKFPLETFQRLLETDKNTAVDAETKSQKRKVFLDVVKKHMDVIAQKYIRPEAGTYEFALMYLPAESLYYEAVIRESSTIILHSTNSRVVPVSPNTLYAYLLTVSYGLKGMQIEQQAEKIRQELVTIQKKFYDFSKSYELIGTHLARAQKSYDDTSKQVERLQDRMQHVTETEPIQHLPETPKIDMKLVGS